MPFYQNQTKFGKLLNSLIDQLFEGTSTYLVPRQYFTYNKKALREPVPVPVPRQCFILVHEPAPVPHVYVPVHALIPVPVHEPVTVNVPGPGPGQYNI